MRNAIITPKELNEAIDYCKNVFNLLGMEVSNSDLLLGNREARTVLKRHIASYILRKKGYSFPTIGTILNKDHATVIHSVKIIKTKEGTLKNRVDIAIEVTDRNDTKQLIQFHEKEIIRLKKLKYT